MSEYIWVLSEVDSITNQKLHFFTGWFQNSLFGFFVETDSHYVWDAYIGLLQNYLWTISSYNNLNEVSVKHSPFLFKIPSYNYSMKTGRETTILKNSKMKGRICFFWAFCRCYVEHVLATKVHIFLEGHKIS